MTLDYHGTLEAYAEAKALLFKFKTLKAVVINLDDTYANVMLDAAKTIHHNRKSSPIL